MVVQNCWDVGKGRHSISNAKKGMMSNRVGHKRRFDATVDHCLADSRLTILVLIVKNGLSSLRSKVGGDPMA